MLTPEQVKRVEEIRAQLSRYGNRSDVLATTADTLLAIVDDLRKQLNAAVLLGQAAASLNKPMTDAEFKKELSANGPTNKAG